MPARGVRRWTPGAKRSERALDLHARRAASKTVSQDRSERRRQRQVEARAESGSDDETEVAAQVPGDAASECQAEAEPRCRVVRRGFAALPRLDVRLAGTPGPSSSTAMTTRGPARRALSRTVPRARGVGGGSAGAAPTARVRRRVRGHASVPL